MDVNVLPSINKGLSFPSFLNFKAYTDEGKVMSC